jgi:hypothetical protein
MTEEGKTPKVYPFNITHSLILAYREESEAEATVRGLLRLGSTALPRIYIEPVTIIHVFNTFM